MRAIVVCATTSLSSVLLPRYGYSIHWSQLLAHVAHAIAFYQLASLGGHIQLSYSGGDCGVQVGNYDYMYDIRLRLDGEIDVRVFMAGALATGRVSNVESADLFTLCPALTETAFT